MITREKIKEWMKNSIVDMDTKRRLVVRLMTKGDDGKYTDEVEIGDVVKSIAEYVDREASAHSSKVVERAMPLMVHTVLNSLEVTMKKNPFGGMTLLSEPAKNMIITQMLHAFYLEKFLKKNDIKIVTEQVQLTDEEFETQVKLGKISKALGLGAATGLAQEEAVRAMLDTDFATEEDLNLLGITKSVIKAARNLVLEDAPEDNKAQQN